MSDAGNEPLDARMSDAVEAMDRDFNHIRTGRASTSLVERSQRIRCWYARALAWGGKGSIWRGFAR